MSLTDCPTIVLLGEVQQTTCAHLGKHLQIPPGSLPILFPGHVQHGVYIQCQILEYWQRSPSLS